MLDVVRNIEYNLQISLSVTNRLKYVMHYVICEFNLPSRALSGFFIDFKFFSFLCFLKNLFFLFCFVNLLLHHFGRVGDIPYRRKIQHTRRHLVSKMSKKNEELNPNLIQI